MQGTDGPYSWAVVRCMQWGLATPDRNRTAAHFFYFMNKDYPFACRGEIKPKHTNMKTTMKMYGILFSLGLLSVAGCQKDEGNDNGDQTFEGSVTAQYEPLSDGSLPTVQIAGDFSVVTGSTRWNAIAYGNGKYFAVGSEGSVATSADGSVWEEASVGTDGWNGIAYSVADEVFVAVGDAGMTARTSDGESWSLSRLGNEPWNDVECYNEKRVAEDGKESWSSYLAAVSMNGRINNFDGLTTAGSEDWFCVTYNGRSFMAAGSEGSVATSSDRETWSVQTAGTANWNGAAFGNNVYVVVGDGGNIAYSSDTQTWKQVASGTETWNDVVYSDGYFVAVGNGGNIAYSADGITWTSVNSGTQNDIFSVCVVRGE